MNEEIIYPPCKICGKSHGMGIEERETGKIEPIDLCYDCLWGGVKFNVITENVFSELSSNPTEEFVMKKLQDTLKEILGKDEER